MITISPNDFYRLWLLAAQGREDLNKHNPIGDATVQRVRNEDAVLIRKVKNCWELGLTAEFRTKQI